MWQRSFKLIKTIDYWTINFLVTLAILNNEIRTYGVQIPTKKEFYEPILRELKEFGVIFNEKEVKYFGYNPLNV